MKQDIRILIDLLIGMVISALLNFALIIIGYFQFDQKHPFKENGSLKLRGKHQNGYKHKSFGACFFTALATDMADKLKVYL